MRLILNLALLFCILNPVIGAPAVDSLPDAISQGKTTLNVRTRYETVSQSGLNDASALTLRARLGVATAPIHGLTAFLELEHISALDSDSYSYNQAGLNPGGADRAVIADPEETEINQAALAYTQDNSIITLGRQRLVFDNARFVGDVGWRQNMQTFDAITLQSKLCSDTTLTYAWFHRINRIFGADHPQGRWDSNSHLLNVSHAGFAAGTLTGYAYLLDFDNSPANSCATYGASFAGAQTLSVAKLTYRTELALQSDYGPSPLDYQANYRAFEVGLTRSNYGINFGQERLSSDHGVGFRTPLATLHAFNGWADLFLATPAAGLRDSYVKATGKLPAGFNLLAFYHQFDRASGTTDFGHEFDLQLARKFNRQFTCLVKFADFRRSNPAYSNVQKVWLQLEFAH